MLKLNKKFQIRIYKLFSIKGSRFFSYFLVYIFILSFIFAPSITFAQIVITEITCNPIGKDSEWEWMKVANVGNVQVDLTDWKIDDGKHHILNEPPKNGGRGTLIIQSNKEVIFANKAENIDFGDIVIDSTFSLSNSGDVISIIDNNGITRDVAEYKEKDVVEGGPCYKNTTGTPTIDSEAVAISEDPNGSVLTENSDKNNEGNESLFSYFDSEEEDGAEYNNDKYVFESVTVQPPEDVHIRQIQNNTVMVGTDFSFNIEAYNELGDSVSGECYINFGDGGEIGEGCTSTHSYMLPGEYVVSVKLRDGELVDEMRFMVRVIKSHIVLRLHLDKSKFGERYVEVYNNSDDILELNGIRLRIDKYYYDIPDNTVLLSHKSIKINESMFGIRLDSTDKIVLLDAGGVEMQDEFEVLQIESELESVDDIKSKIVHTKELIASIDSALTMMTSRDGEFDNVHKVPLADIVSDFNGTSTPVSILNSKQRTRDGFTQGSIVLQDSRVKKPDASLSVDNRKLLYKNIGESLPLDFKEVHQEDLDNGMSETIKDQYPVAIKSAGRGGMVKYNPYSLDKMSHLLLNAFYFVIVAVVIAVIPTYLAWMLHGRNDSGDKYTNKDKRHTSYKDIGHSEIEEDAKKYSIEDV